MKYTVDRHLVGREALERVRKPEAPGRAYLGSGEHWGRKENEVVTSI